VQVVDVHDGSRLELEARERETLGRVAVAAVRALRSEALFPLLAIETGELEVREVVEPVAAVLFAVMNG
jgi:hypothetical protein